MRDGARKRETVDLSLDRRQVAGIAIGAGAFLGLVFGLGLLVGKQLGTSAPRPAPTELEALDAQRQDADKSALAAPRAAPARSAPAPAAEPAPPPTSAPVTVAAPAKAVEVRRPVPPVEASPVPAAASVAGRSTVEVPAPRSLAVPPPRVSTLPPAPADVGAFTVQIGASQDRGEAHRLEARARLAGLRPYVVEVHLGAKGTWYRVRVGAFANREAANRFRKDAERELRVSAAVMPSR